MKRVTFDPGEATGYSVWVDDELVHAGTASLREAVQALGWVLGVWPEHAPAFDGDEELAHRLQGVDEVVIEDWALYPWELENLAWDKCRTARGIGALEFICQVAEVPYRLQPASIKDTAKAAGAEAFFLRPLHENRHANDAIMHGVVAKLGAASG